MKGKQCFEQNTFGALLYPKYLKEIAKLAKPQVLLGSRSPDLKCRIPFHHHSPQASLLTTGNL